MWNVDKEDKQDLGRRVWEDKEDKQDLGRRVWDDGCGRMKKVWSVMSAKLGIKNS